MFLFWSFTVSNIKSYQKFYLSGENVKDLFNRISAICFDQAVLRELEDQKVKSEKVKLCGGSANSGLQTIRKNLLLFLSFRLHGELKRKFLLMEMKSTVEYHGICLNFVYLISVSGNLVPRVSSLLYLYSGIQEAIRQSDWMFAILRRCSVLGRVNSLDM